MSSGYENKTNCLYEPEEQHNCQAIPMIRMVDGIAILRARGRGSKNSVEAGVAATFGVAGGQAGSDDEVAQGPCGVRARAPDRFAVS